MMMLMFLGTILQAPAASIPDGSYRHTCRAVSVRADRLTASCQTIQGQWERSSLFNWRQCDGAITNIDGQLRCERRLRIPSVIPGGSYVETCTDIRASSGTLYATCKTRDGRWAHTRLAEARSCDGEVANIDGALECI